MDEPAKAEITHHSLIQQKCANVSITVNREYNYMIYTQTIKCISVGNMSDFTTQHPQIQKKSQYIKYLCCDDVRTLHQWVNGIRIAKVTSRYNDIPPFYVMCIARYCG